MENEDGPRIGYRQWFPFSALALSGGQRNPGNRGARSGGAGLITRTAVPGLFTELQKSFVPQNHLFFFTLSTMVGYERIRLD